MVGEVASGGYGTSFYTRSAKRTFDVWVALLILLASAPFIGLLYLLVRLDGGPGFYGHMRIGRNGTPFRCWKLRTMVVNSEARLRELLERDPAAAAEWAATFKLTSDPRITAIGRFLRRTSLDEFPQLWNIVLGQMSFVGPRPVTEKELQIYGSLAGNYLSCLPGLTGLWQVSGRNDVSYADRVKLDMEYLASVSFLQDLRIIGRTAGVVLRRTGR